MGHDDDLFVQVTVAGGDIAGISVLLCDDTIGIGSTAAPMMATRILEAKNIDVDTVTGATTTSMAVQSAVADAITNAGVLICFWHLVGLSTYFGSPLEGSCRQSRLRGGKRLWFKELLLSGLVVSYSASGCTVLYSLPMYLLLYSANSGRRTRSSGVRDFRKSAS